MIPVGKISRTRFGINLHGLLDLIEGSPRKAIEPGLDNPIIWPIPLEFIFGSADTTFRKPA